MGGDSPGKTGDIKTAARGVAQRAQGQGVGNGYGGSFSTYHVRLATGKTLTAIRANRERSLEKSITWEDEVYLSWSPGSAVLLTE